MRKRTRGGLGLPLIACGLLLAFSIPAGAQQPSGNPPAPAEPQSQAPVSGEQKPSDDSKKNTQPQKQSGTSRDRILFLLPNFMTLENGANVPPLTTGQKFKTVARGTFDPVQFGYYVVIAGIGQASDDEEGYGQGMQGYGKRFGAIVADTTIENFMVGAVFPSLLKQDPRYFQKGTGSAGGRFWYALTRIFVIRGDNGHQQFNASEIFGSALAAGISTFSYHPRGDRKIGNLAGTWATQIALDSFANSMKEFWPDIRRRLRRNKATEADTKSPGR